VNKKRSDYSIRSIKLINKGGDIKLKSLKLINKGGAWAVFKKMENYS
jgi:hypothetical protein